YVSRFLKARKREPCQTNELCESARFVTPRMRDHRRNQQHLRSWFCCKAASVASESSCGNYEKRADGANKLSQERGARESLIFRQGLNPHLFRLVSTCTQTCSLCSPYPRPAQRQRMMLHQLLRPILRRRLISKLL